MTVPRKLSFDRCFDDCKIAELLGILPQTYAAMNKMAPWRKGKWPTKVRCMSNSKILDGRRRGAGHGYTYVQGEDTNGIWMNPHMTSEGYWLVFVHENLHHGFPDATEDELNNVLVPEVYKRVFGKPMNKAWARKHGLGPPQPGIGDRGYAY